MSHAEEVKKDFEDLYGNVSSSSDEELSDDEEKVKVYIKPTDAENDNDLKEESSEQKEKGETNEKNEDENVLEINQSSQFVPLTVGFRGFDKTGPKINPKVYETEMGKLEDKPWEKDGAKLSDYFNYGFSESTFLEYCQNRFNIYDHYKLNPAEPKNVEKQKNVISSPEVNPIQVLSGTPQMAKANENSIPPEIKSEIQVPRNFPMELENPTYENEMEVVLNGKRETRDSVKRESINRHLIQTNSPKDGDNLREKNRGFEEDRTRRRDYGRRRESRDRDSRSYSRNRERDSRDRYDSRKRERSYYSDRERKRYKR